MTSTERLLAVLAGQMPDRVPISTYEIVGWDSQAWENQEPSYRCLMDFIRGNTDCIYMTSIGVPNTWDGGNFQVDRYDKGPQHHEQMSLTLPSGRVLTRHAMHTDDLHTTWTLKHWCDNLDEAEEMVHLPWLPGAVDFSNLLRARRDLEGHRGIPMFSMADPLCEVSELMEFGEFMVAGLTQTDRVEAMLEHVHQRRLRDLEMMLDHPQIAGTLWRLVGPEYACPPYLPPEIFARFVTRFNRAYARLIRQAGAYTRIHIHGKIGRVLDEVAKTEVDGIDPAEPPPDGDIEIRDIKARCPSLCIIGGIELKHLEATGGDFVEELVRGLMAQGKPGGRFVLMPTAAPINVPLSPKTEANYIRFIETALEAGKY